jgi:DNA polymerase III delta prime subunit
MTKEVVENEKEILITTSLAVKYRPKKISDLIGQDHVAAQLRGMVKTRKFPSAILITGLPGTGKCVVGDTLVKTPLGLIPIENMIHDAGEHCVSGIALVNGFSNVEEPTHSYKKKARTIKVTAEAGYHVEGTQIHPIFVMDGASGKLVWKKLQSITFDDYLLQSALSTNTPTKHAKVKFQNKPHDENNVSLHQFTAPSHIDACVARLLGLLVTESFFADTNKLQLSCEDYNILALFENDLKACDQKVVVTHKQRKDKIPKVCVKEAYNIVKYFESCGLQLKHCNEAVIPSGVLCSPNAIRAEFLKTYFEVCAYWHKGIIEATSKSKELIKQIQILLLDFNIHSNIESKYREVAKLGLIEHFILKIEDANSDIFMDKIGFLSLIKDEAYKDARIENAEVMPYCLMKRLYNWSKTYGSACENGLYKNCFDQSVSLNLEQLLHDTTIQSWVKWFKKHRDTIYKMGGELIAIMHDVEYIALMNCKMSKVKSISKGDKEKWVYDFTLPRTHSFMANGVINHNTTIAQLVNRYVNCSTYNACGKCDSCTRASHPDLIEINIGDTRGINDIRSIVSTSNMMPKFNKRVMLLDEVHSLTSQAEGAFLVPLETPSKNTIYLLATTDPEKVLSTIISRCLRFELKSISVDDVVKRLLQIAELEGVDFNEIENGIESIELLASLSNGQMRDAIQVLESLLLILASGKNIDLKLVMANFKKAFSVDVERAAARTLFYCLKLDLRGILKYSLGVEKPRVLLSKMRWLINFLLQDFVDPDRYAFKPVAILEFYKITTHKPIKINYANLIMLQSVLTHAELTMNSASINEGIILTSAFGDYIANIIKSESTS